MPIIKFVNEDENIEYAKEQDLCSLLCYAFDSEKTEFQGHRLVGCKPFGFPQEYMTNPLADMNLWSSTIRDSINIKDHLQNIE